MHIEPQPAPTLPRVVIVGAGFGGLAAARAMRKMPVEVLLVDQRNHHTFQPLLYQVATAGLEPEEIAHAVRGIYHGQANFRFHLGRVRGVDWGASELALEDGERLSFEFLILAAGATTNDYGIAGVAEHAFGLKSLEDAVRLRTHILEEFERASRHPASIADGALHFIVAGGGPTGVEMAGALVELFAHVLAKDYPELDVARARVTLLERETRLLAPFHDSLQRYALAQLKRRGVDVKLGASVKSVTAHEVTLESGESLRTTTLIWAAGVRAHPLASTLGLEQTRGGRIVVSPDLSVPQHPSTFVIGDMAASRDEHGELHPQLAPVAMQGAAHAAEMIRKRISSQPTRPFVYTDRGTMATIGRHAAVAQFPSGLRFRGFLAWTTWLLLHLIQLIGFRNRLNVLVNWTWNYFTYDRGARLIIETHRESTPKPRPQDSNSLP